ncbi:MAG TPA: hypothetical protein VK846_15395, partial [Candidatus Limnocylindria bacterium]|nr:hypothetical protein [Candidatus Limnocylindria bacterium]
LLVLSLEVVVQHQLAQLTINSIFSSATVLVIVLLALALASALVPLLRKVGGGNVRVVLLLAAAACFAQPFILTQLRPGLAILPYELTVGPYMRELAWLGLLAICPLFVVTGLVFPMLLRGLTDQKPNARSVGMLLAWNGLGGWLGTELTQGWLAPQLGMWTSVIVVGIVYLLLASFATAWIEPAPFTPRKSFRFALIPVFLLAGAGVLVGLQQSQKLPQATVAPNERLAALRVGREGVVATLECGPGDWRMLFNNSYTLGGSKAQFNQERQAHLPILLHGRAKTVACLGVATGSTVAGAAVHREVEHIDAIELSPLVLDYAREFFAPFNRNVFTNTRVNFIPEDARRVVAQRAAAYDVVTGDLFLPWRTGEGRLFTREHFEAVRRSMKTDGIYCQWLPMFQLTRAQFDAIIRTFREVFPEAFLLRGDFYTELPILGLVGGRSLNQINWSQVDLACQRLRRDGAVADPLVRHLEGVAMMVIGELPSTPPGPVNTLANAWLEWNAGQNILGMKTPWFIGVPCAEWVRDVQRASVSALPEQLRNAHDGGQFFLTLEVVAKLKLPQLAQMESQINERLPKPLRDDAGANWSQWPMRLKPERTAAGATNKIRNSSSN